MAQQENAPNKPVHLIYFCGGIVLFYLVQWSIDWIWGYFARPPGELFLSGVGALIAITTATVLYRSDRVHGLTTEITAELKKVTWPSAKEIRAATTVVFVMAIISAVILGVFDLVWSKLTDLVYG